MTVKAKEKKIPHAILLPVCHTENSHFIGNHGSQLYD